MPLGDEEHTIPSTLAIPGVILPSQFYGAAGSRTLSSEQRLMLAVLVDAINIVRGSRFAAGRKRRSFAEAGRWIFARDNSRLFSFENVCEALDINPRVLRGQLAHGPAGFLGAAQPRTRRLRLKESARSARIAINRRRRPRSRSDGSL